MDLLESTKPKASYSAFFSVSIVFVVSYLYTSTLLFYLNILCIFWSNSLIESAFVILNQVFLENLLPM